MPHHHHHHRRSRDRSRSPTRHSKSGRTRSPPPSIPVSLPFGASQLRRHDFDHHKPMFGLYLEIQKQKVLEELPEAEVKGRWKSFISKWNRGELVEGWYDPATLERAHTAAKQNELEEKSANAPKAMDPKHHYEEEDDDVGPSLPTAHARSDSGGHQGAMSGPAIPNLQDLEMQAELRQENREAELGELRHERRTDRLVQKERLEELVPRAEAGSRDRQLEKKREKADSNRAFAAAKTAGDGLAEVPESELLGDEGGFESFKRQKADHERKKNERELKREDILRARAAEREERVRAYKEKEAETMSGLVALAKARFG